MKCLVTGGAGFIGSNVIHRLLEHGHEATMFDNYSTGYINLKPYPEAGFGQGNIREAGAVEAAVSGKAAVFHLAVSVGNKKFIDERIYDASHNVLEAMRKYEVGNIVYSSSAGVFGEPQYQPIDEAHPSEPDSPYGATKLRGEKLVLSYSKLYGTKAACLRCFNIYGENQRFNAYGNGTPIFARIARRETLNIFGDGEQTRDFIDVAAAENPQARGTFNICTSTEMTISWIVEILRDVTGEDSEVLHGAPRPGDIRHCTAYATCLRKILGVSPGADIPKNLKRYYSWMVSDPIYVEKISW